MSSIETVLQETRVFPPAPEFVKQANVSGMQAYRAMCAEAEKDFEGFWGKHAKNELLWHKPFSKTLDESNAPFFKWFYDGELNASYNCLDRHLETQPDKVAIIFEADDGKVTKITYKALYHEVCRFANALKSHGVRTGDRVLIYMPMSIQVVVAMQACARIGATHSVVFGGFSAKSLQERIIDAGATEVIISSAKRWAILHELREDAEWDLPDLIAKMSPVDLVLVEGYKRDPFPKLEVHRAANGKPLIHPEDPHVMAIASDIALPAAKVPVVGLDDIEAIADLLLKHAVPVSEAPVMRSA